MWRTSLCLKGCIRIRRVLGFGEQCTISGKEMETEMETVVVQAFIGTMFLQERGRPQDFRVM